MRDVIKHRLFWPALALGCCVILLSGCATLPGAQRLSLETAQQAVIAADGAADPDTLANYAAALVRAGSFSQALGVLSGTTQPAEPNARWLNLQAACEAELGDKPGAKRDFETAAAMGSEAARVNLEKLEAGPPPGRTGKP